MLGSEVFWPEVPTDACDSVFSGWWGSPGMKERGVLGGEWANNGLAYMPSATMHLPGLRLISTSF